METKKDNIYTEPMGKIGHFVFNQQVAEVFDDMIQRSVPGYDAVVNMTGCLAGQYAKSGTCVYDLGCSLGASTLAMRERIAQDILIVAVDNSQAMLDECRQRMSENYHGARVTFLCEDIQDVKIENASFVVLNFTLQFIEPSQRQQLIQRIYDGMMDTAALVISEKIAFNDPKEQQLQTQLHYTFKKLNGYSDLEIAQKRSALEKVLVPETVEVHFDRLKKCGFKQASKWFQSFNFASMVAFK